MRIRLLIGAILTGLILFPLTLHHREPFNPLSRSPISKLSLKRSERPKTYQLVQSSELLTSLGMHRNPDYIRSLSELEAVGRRGALDSFAAIYGLADQPRLILNGLYFEDHDQLEAFLAHQKNKKRRVVGFEKDTTDGFWLLVLACDPGLTYDTATINEIKQAAQRYRRRLGLTELFNNLDDDATGSSPSPPPDPTGSTPSNAPTD